MEHHDVVIVGGGNAGISLGARLVRSGASDVAILESQPVHRYRPLLNYVGGGQAGMRDLERPSSAVAPAGCTWIADSVVGVDPGESIVCTAAGRRVHYTTLVVCPGLEEDWDATPGLRSAYAEGWAGSTFVPTSAASVWPRLRSVTSGRVVFTVPPEPAPCAATALKPLLLACDHWRRSGRLADLEVRLVLPRSSVTGLSAADDRLDEVLTSYGVDVLRESRGLSRLRVLWGQLRNPLLLLLVFAAGASAVTGQWVDAAIVFTILAATVGVGYSREYRAQAAADELRARVRAETRVLRDGQPTSLPLREVVPGDVVLLAAGSLLPADTVVLEQSTSVDVRAP